MIYKNTNKRYIIKGITWRILATVTTMIIIYLFFGNIELAIAAGFLETILKIILYWWHEKIWDKLKLGKKKIEPFNIVIFGLPLSGKTEIANQLFQKIREQNKKILIERIDSKEIRQLIPELGYKKEDVIIHFKRISYLINILQKNHISSISSFVLPYQESRDYLKKNNNRNILIYIDSSIEICKSRDTQGKYQKAKEKIYENFPGVNGIYEPIKNVDLVINNNDNNKENIKKSVDKIYNYLILNKYI